MTAMDRIAEQIAGYAAGRHFAQARLVIGACYNDIRADPLCLVQQARADRIPYQPVEKSSVAGYHPTTKHNAAKAV